MGPAVLMQVRRSFITVREVETDVLRGDGFLLWHPLQTVIGCITFTWLSVNLGLHLQNAFSECGEGHAKGRWLWVGTPGLADVSDVSCAAGSSLSTCPLSPDCICQKAPHLPLTGFLTWKQGREKFR